MKCVGGINHKYLQWPTSYTNNIHSQVSESKYQGVAASLWPVATVQGAETLYICMKKTCYEYELDGGINHKNKQTPTSHTNNIQHSSSPNSSYKAGSASLWPLATVSGAEIHNIYMYQVDLLGGLNHNLTWKHLHNLLLLRLSP